MNREDVAWAAGLFDGEGCVSLEKRKTYPVLLMSMTDRDLVERFEKVMGFGHVTYRHQQKRGYQPQWAWRASGFEKAQAMYAMFWPWLGLRRKARFEEVLLAYLDAPIQRRSFIGIERKLGTSKGNQESGSSVWLPILQSTCASTRVSTTRRTVSTLDRRTPSSPLVGSLC